MYDKVTLFLVNVQGKSNSLGNSFNTSCKINMTKILSFLEILDKGMTKEVLVYSTYIEGSVSQFCHNINDILSID